MSTGRKVALIAAAIVGAAALVFILQNSEEVDVEWLGFQIRAPLFVIVILAGATAIGLRDLIGWTLRRRRSMAERRRAGRSADENMKGTEE
jgi:uncharacterized integral membrane protein